MLFAALGLYAQEADTSYWATSGVGTLNFTNTGFGKYWQAGGTSAFSVSGLFNFVGNYEKEKNTWQNSLDVAYGLVRQGKLDEANKDRYRALQKAEDRLDFQSKYGYKLNPTLNLGAFFGLRTQLAKGLKIDPALGKEFKDSVVSKAFAPAYINFNVGIDYQPSKQLSIYYSPVNSKMTLVGDEALAPFFIPQENLPDVSTFRYELGSFLNIKFRQENIVKNVTLQTKADFFSNYLKNPQNIDVNWETLLALKVNDWLTTSFFTHLIYDKDIVFNLVDDNGLPTGETGDAPQFKHVLSVGLTYNFLGK